MNLKAALAGLTTAKTEHDTALYTFNVAEDDYGPNSVKAKAIQTKKVRPAEDEVDKMSLAVAHAPAKTMLDVMAKMDALLSCEPMEPEIIKQLQFDAKRFLVANEFDNARSGNRQKRGEESLAESFEDWMVELNHVAPLLFIRKLASLAQKDESVMSALVEATQEANLETTDIKGDQPEPLWDAQVSAADIGNLATTAQVVTGFALADIEDEPRIVALIGAVDAIKREADCLQNHLIEVGRQTNVA